ncbi:MAG: hypothetical protein AAB709_01785 [Patescibacteria group bacterium]
MSSPERTSLFLMANLGAEVSRVISAKERGDTVLMQGALERAGLMLDEIKKSPDMQPRMSEIEMLSQAIQSIVNPVSELRIASQNIKSYFTPFALRMMSV